MQLTDLVDCEEHPLGSTAWLTAQASELNRRGVLVLPGFFTPQLVSAVVAESADRTEEAFYTRSTHNVWLTDPDPQLGDAHVFNRQITSSKGLLADDQIPAASPLRVVYDHPTFNAAIAAIVGSPQLHPYADPLSSINVHFHNDGQELGWHFDNSEFAVTALLQAPEAGGQFEFVADIREDANGHENFDGVERVLDGETPAERLAMEPGDLVLFRGRRSMHRVTPSVGPVTRILVVFAWNSEPGVSLSASAQQTFFGRTA